MTSDLHKSGLHRNAAYRWRIAKILFYPVSGWRRAKKVKIWLKNMFILTLILSLTTISTNKAH